MLVKSVTLASIDDVLFPSKYASSKVNLGYKVISFGISYIESLLYVLPVP